MGTAAPGGAADATTLPAGQQMFDTNELRNLPGYQFALGEGQSAIDRSMAARGRGRSGAHDKATMRFSQGLADQNYLNYLNPYFTLAGMGQVSAGQGAAGAQNLGNQLSNIYMTQGATQGAARASNYANQANIWGNVMNNLAGGAMSYGMWK